MIDPTREAAEADLIEHAEALVGAYGKPPITTILQACEALIDLGDADDSHIWAVRLEPWNEEHYSAAHSMYRVCRWVVFQPFRQPVTLLSYATEDEAVAEFERRANAPT